MTFPLLLKQQPFRIMRLLIGSGAFLLLLACSLLLADRASAHGSLEDGRAELCMNGVNVNCGAVQYEPWSVEGRGDFPEIGVPDGQITGGGKYEPLFAQTDSRWSKVDMKGGPFTFHWTIVANHSTNRWDYYITKPGWDPNEPITRADLELFCRYEDNSAIPPNNVYNDCVIPNDREGYHVIIGVWDIFDTVNAFYQAMDVNLTIDPSQPTTPDPGYPGDPNRFGEIRDWSVIRPYNAGEQVVHNGYIWQAKWWNRGQEPGATDVWQQIGPVTGTPTVPGEPTALAATAGNAQVTLSWAASSGATGYTVKRSTVSGGPYTDVATVTTTSYTDTGLTNGTTYYYVVSAANSAGSSGNSAQASATPIGATTQAPAAPTGLAAMGHDAHVMLSWAASSGATSYTVKRAIVSGGPYTDVAIVTTTSYVDMGLTNGTTYYYVVSASNSAGTSANSAQIASTPSALPGSLTVSGTAGDAIATLNWTASMGAASYVVERATGSGTYVTIASNLTGLTYADTTAVNGTLYNYRIVAVNASGSTISNVVALTPSAPIPTNGLVVQYKVTSNNPSDNMIYMTFNIKNTGTSAVSLSGVKLRYYLTKDSSSATLSHWVDYAQVGAGNITGAFATLSPAKTNADTYLELSFAAGAGTIAADGQSGEIQVRIAKSDWSNFNEANDYSFGGTYSSFTDWNKVTLYQGGTLVWGIEP